MRTVCGGASSSSESLRVNSPSSCFASSERFTTRTSESPSLFSSVVSDTNFSRSSSSTSSISTSSPSIFTVFLPAAFKAFCAATSALGFWPDDAAFIASNSAFVGKSLGPALFLSFFAASASRANFNASSSAFVGKSLGPALFLSFLPTFLLVFAALFFTADFFGAFLGARDKGTKILCFCSSDLLETCHLGRWLWLYYKLSTGLNALSNAFF